MKVCYLFLLPYALLFFTFIILPICTSIFYSFTYYNILEEPRFVGFQNYINLVLQDEVFLTAIKNTFVIAVVTGPIGYILSFLFAWFINELPRWLRTVAVVVFYAPSIAGGAYSVFLTLFRGDAYGWLNSILLQFGVIDAPILFRNNAGQWLEWELNVPDDGWYCITIKARQNHQRGAISCRSLYIDGEIPCEEVSSISFGYNTAWEMNTLSDSEGTPLQFYLPAGNHTIRLEATLGEMGSILQEMDDSIYRLNQIYRKILVLTGVSPDRFRDYNLESIYPEIIEGMDLEAKRLYKLVDDTVAVTGQKSDRIAVAQTLAVQLEGFVPDRRTGMRRDHLQRFRLQRGRAAGGEALYRQAAEDQRYPGHRGSRGRSTPHPEEPEL